MRWLRSRQGPAVAGLVLLAAVLLAGCGAPAYTYVKNSADHMYVKIPASWHSIDQKDLDDAIGLDPAEDASSRGLWLQAYDAAETPSPLHLFGSSATEPAALVSVQQVPESSRGGLSLDGLRDFFFPVSPTARQNSQNPQLTGFGLVTDDVLTPGDGLRGVHTVFRYSLGGGPPQMMDQTALPQRRREQGLRAARPLLDHLLQGPPRRDRERGVLVHHPGETMTAPVAHPPEGLSAPDEPPHAPPPPTRPPMPFWNRIRLLLLFAIAWLILVWAAMADNPLLPFVDSVRIQLHDSQWLIWLAGLELLRQVHYLIEERSARYHRFWSQKVFGAADRAVRTADVGLDPVPAGPDDQGRR